MRASFFISAILLGLTIHAVGQTISNSGFEDWTWIGGWFENPDGWTSNNTQVLTPVLKDTVPHQGNFAVQVNNNGFLRSGFALTQRPVDVQVFVKSNITGPDSVTINIFVYSGGSIVDSGVWTNTASITDWTLQTIPITQNTTGIDSLEIQINGGTQTGTSLIIDDFDIGITGIDEAENDQSWSLFPNPMTDFATLTFDNSSKENHHLVIYSTTGKRVRTIRNIAAEQIIIEKGDLASSIYFFELRTGWYVVASGKLMVE